jgi:hypothetical protein
MIRDVLRSNAIWFIAAEPGFDDGQTGCATANRERVNRQRCECLIGGPIARRAIVDRQSGILALHTQTIALGTASVPSCLRPSRVPRWRAGLTAALDTRCARWPCGTWPGRRNGPCSDRIKELRKDCDGFASSVLLSDPKRLRPPDDRVCRHKSEISPIERVHRLPVHEEDLTLGNDVAALPDRQRSASAVVLARLAHFEIIDGDDETASANCLPGMGTPRGR